MGTFDLFQNHLNLIEFDDLVQCSMMHIWAIKFVLFFLLWLIQFRSWNRLNSIDGPRRWLGRRRHKQKKTISWNWKLVASFSTLLAWLTFLLESSVKQPCPSATWTQIIGTLIDYMRIKFRWIHLDRIRNEFEGVKSNAPSYNNTCKSTILWAGSLSTCYWPSLACVTACHLHATLRAFP